MEILKIFTYTKQILFLRIKKAQPTRKKIIWSRDREAFFCSYKVLANSKTDSKDLLLNRTRRLHSLPFVLQSHQILERPCSVVVRGFTLAPANCWRDRSLGYQVTETMQVINLSIFRWKFFPN